MSDSDRPVEGVLAALQERAKELNCLYEVEQALNQVDQPLDVACQKVVEAIPPGWQYPDVCSAMLEYDEHRFACPDFEMTPWLQEADIVVQDERIGRICVVYLEERPREDVGPFLKEEERLIRTIADRVGHSILYHQLHHMRREWEQASRTADDADHQRWRGPIDLLRRTDRTLYLRIARKMVNHLCWVGITGAQELLQTTYGGAPDPEAAGDSNAPIRSRVFNDSPLLSGEPFLLASQTLGDDEVLHLIQAWITEDRASFLPKLLNNERTSLAEVAEGLRRFHHLMVDGGGLSESTLNGMRVSLIRRFLTEQLDFITIAKRHIQIEDFGELLDRVILSASSHGKLGGKSSGLFLADKVLRDHRGNGDGVGVVKVPKSWYIASEGLMHFIESNDLEEVLQQKYRDIAQVRHEYPNIIQLFRNSRFPRDIVKGVSVLLDEVGDSPLIVRSSSLLEDSLGSAFSGKYKSLFLANQGSKNERMAALLDAITEVYASVFGPDPIAYRKEKGLLDFHEEMAILVQEVVGTRVGDYFFPALAGVAFSTNEFRWSSRIRREDGLVRLVAGLGTRAVDRTPDDYPVLAVPRKPKLRANTTIDEIVRYSPSKIDVLNLRTNSFVTRTLDELLAEVGTDYPAFELVFSLLQNDTLRRPVPLLAKPESQTYVADFGGLVDSTDFVARVGRMLTVLEHALECPVDIEFAFDGTDLYLLQCRPQSSAAEDAPAPIPKEVPKQNVIFSADRYVSNGWVPDVSHVVYVDPDAYRELPERSDYLRVGQAVGELNKTLPKRQFILIGPGRWGSRGDVRLGVPVTYSDINNTSMLIEVARRTASYVPDLSFGTHFFQDLVESRIRYLPLYPDDGGGSLNDAFLTSAPNLLPDLAPEFADLEAVVRVVDVASATGGRMLRVLMNSELDRALGLLVAPESDGPELSPAQRRDAAARRSPEEFWRWRMRMAERIAAEADADRFGIEAMYIIGSTKNASAGPASDIDLLVHVNGDPGRRRDLEAWLEGWSLCLGEVNSMRTGYTSRGLLDVHYITDEDVERRTSFASKIGAVTDPARLLVVGVGRRDEGGEVSEEQ
jgi:pyruvate,water dikinase